MAENINGVAFQFFHWYLDKDDSYQGNKSLWLFLTEQADPLREIGIDAVWIPPSYKGASGDSSSGYDLYDHFDLGEFNDKGTVRTKYGSKEELHDAVKGVQLSQSKLMTQHGDE